MAKEKTRLGHILLLLAFIGLFAGREAITRAKPTSTTGNPAAAFKGKDSTSRLKSSESLFRRGVRKIGEFRISEGSIIGSRDLSGIARVGEFHCLIASDEGIYVQTCRLVAERREVIIDEPARSRIELLSAKVGSEIDIEALTAIGNTYYVMGSHGVAKKSGLFLKPRHMCFRFEVDPKTGERNGNIQRSSLQKLLHNDSVLGAYYGKALQQRGVNIEGLAAKDGKLFIGFRSPNLNGKAYVVEIWPEVLFGGHNKLSYRLHTVALGAGLGIREIVTIQSENDYNGFLIIAGNAGCKPGDSDEPDTVTNIKDWEQGRGFFLFYWDGRERVEVIGEIPRASDDYKAEAMTVVSDTKDALDLLILFDGPAGGAPTVYRIYKKKKE